MVPQLVVFSGGQGGQSPAHTPQQHIRAQALVAVTLFRNGPPSLSPAGLVSFHRFNNVELTQVYPPDSLLCVVRWASQRELTTVGNFLLLTKPIYITTGQSRWPLTESIRSIEGPERVLTRMNKMPGRLTFPIISPIPPSPLPRAPNSLTQSDSSHVSACHT